MSLDSNPHANQSDDKKSHSINPIGAVVGAIVVALLISAVNLVLFIRSDMYEKVKLIQNPEQVLDSDTILDTTSPLTSEQLNQIQKDISSEFELLRDDSDYSIYDISEISLGI